MNAPIDPILLGAALPAWLGAFAGVSWNQLWVASPVAWAGVLEGGILAAGAAGQLHLLRAGKRHRAGLEAIRRALDNANYQEAWEACRRHAPTSLSRLLAPSLEKIGDGRESLAAALAAAARREHRRHNLWRFALLAVGFALPTAAVLLASAGIHALTQAETTSLTPRELTELGGSYALLMAAWFAVAAGSLFAAWASALAGRQEVEAARREVESRLGDLAYEDLAGLRIGRDFAAGTLLAPETPEASTTGRLKVSRTLTSACPRCNAAINSTHRQCPHCQLGLDWT